MAESPLAAEAQKLIGKVLDGRYRLDDILGFGGMGVVFRGVQTSMGRGVAIKTLHPEMAMAPQFFERFKREAEIASRLHHPNIITIFDFGRTQDGLCYYVMELIEGESLRQAVKREGPMSLRHAAAVFEQVAAGVGHAHNQNVVHRDLKPHNIMLSDVDGAQYIKVLDFGLVKALEQDDEEQLTSTGQVLGTPQYMPPEQAGGEVVDQRSDLYSMAGVFYFCLTGTSPFGANTVRKALSASLTQTVPPVATHRIGAPVPRALDALFRKALAREKNDRHQSCEALLTDLHSCLKGVGDAELDALPEGGFESKEGSKGSKAPSQAGSVRGSSKVIVASSIAKPLPKSASSSSERRTPKAATPKAPSLSAGVKATLVAAGLAVLVGGVVLALREKPSDVEQRAPVAPEHVRVTLKTAPTAASVLEDGVLVGKTPLERAWNKGEQHAITFQLDGFQDVQRTFRLQSDEAFEVNLLPMAKAPAPKPAGTKKRSEGDIPAFE